MLALLAMKEPDQRIIEDLKALGVDPRDITKEVAMQARQIEKAIRKGDTAAFREVNRLAGFLDDEGDMGSTVQITMNITQEARDGLTRAIETGAKPRDPEVEE